MGHVEFSPASPAADEEVAGGEYSINLVAVGPEKEKKGAHAPMRRVIAVGHEGLRA